MIEDRFSGNCRCGQVVLEVSGKPAITSACHCSGCQKMSSSAFSLSALFPATSFAVTKGNPVIGGTRGETKHYFCPHCMSWLFTRPAGNDAFVGVRSSLLENPHQYAPFIETWTLEKLPWATTCATHSYERFPAPQDYAALLAQFAERI